MVSNQQTRSIKRTIIIGLGGTGRDVLMRIRRFIIDKYGKIKNFPTISFVHLDTDENDFNKSGLTTGNTYHGERILLETSEQVLLNMNTQSIDDLISELGNTLLESPYSNIEDWLNPQLKTQVTAIQNGTNGIRSVGRLAFFHNYRQIKEAIEKAQLRTSGHESLMLKKGLEVQEGLEIFVVGSLCGGTGSGIFLDVAYSLRHICNNLTQMFGYFVICPKIYSNTALMKANTYAALKELNHYTKDGTIFEACYDKQNQVKVSEKRAPFEFSYLISNQTSGDYQISNKSKLCNVIAYKIFLELSSELSIKMRGARDNFKVPMYNQTDFHPFKMCQGYMTFGLAAIYFTRDRIVQIALNRLTTKLVSFWLEGYGQSPDGHDLLDQFLLTWTTTQSNKNYFITRLEESTQENNKSFNQSLNRWKNSIETEVSDSKTNQDIESLKQSFSRSLKVEFKKVQPGESKSSRGSWLTACQKVQPSLTEQFKMNIDQFLENLLDPDNLNFSLNNALSFLEALRTKFNQDQGEIGEKRQEIKGLYSSEKVDKLWQDTNQAIEDLDKKSSLFNLLSKNHNHDRIKAEILECLQKGQKLMQHNFSVTVNEEATKIIEILQKYLSSRINQIQKLNESLKELDVDYEKYEDELKQLNLDEMTGEGIFPEEAIDQCIPDNGSRVQLVSISHQITQEIVIQSSLFHLIKTPAIIDKQQIKDIVDATIEKSFQMLSTNQVESVIKRFMDSYPIDRRAKRLEQIQQSAKPLLSLNIGDQRFEDGPHKVNHVIGFKHEDKPEVKQFRELLVNNVGGIEESYFEPIQAEDEILMITEYAGFPLRIINELKTMRDIYEEQNKHSILHNEYKISFADIIPPDAKLIDELEFIFYPCLAFEILIYNEDTQEYEFECYNNLLDEYYTAPISSNWREAIERLAFRKDMTDILKANLNQAVVEMKQNPTRLTEGDFLDKYKKFAKQINDLSEDHPNYLYKSKVIGEKATAEKLSKEGVITRFVNKVKQEIEQMQKQQPKANLPSSKTSNGNHKSLSEQIIDTEIE